MSLEDIAFDFAEKKHKGAFRFDGVTPYFEHPKAVARILLTAPMWKKLSDSEKSITLCVASLHDVMEECGVNKSELVKIFGNEVADCVDLLTRIKGIPYSDYLNKIIKSGNKIAMLVKWADSTHNYLDSKNMKDEARKEKIQKKCRNNVEKLSEILEIQEYNFI